MAAPTTSVDSATGEVLIDWVAPFDGGDTIDYYFIEVVDSSGSTWTEDAVNCDGTDATIIANLQCSIPMATL